VVIVTFVRPTPDTGKYCSVSSPEIDGMARTPLLGFSQSGAGGPVEFADNLQLCTKL